MNPNKLLPLPIRIICVNAFLIFSAALPVRIMSQSLLWKISGNGYAETSYLYGTIHLTDQRIFEWKDSVYARMNHCTAFAAELDLSIENMMKAAAFMLLPEGQTLHDRYAPGEYELIRQAVKTCSGYELSFFDKLKPAALISLCFAGSKNGDLEATVDELLYRQAVANGNVTYGIETIEEQVALMDKIPDHYILEYFKNIDNQAYEFEKLIRCYRRADLDSLWLLIQDEESGALLNDELIKERNYRMTERIIPLIRQQSTFIAIGSGHLPGNEGIIALLRKEGFTVEPEPLW